MVTQHQIDTPPLYDMHQLSRPVPWVLRCIGVILTGICIGMWPYTVSAHPQPYGIFAEPTRAKPGDPVKVSFHSFLPQTQPIIYCAANFEGSPSKDCSDLNGEWGYVTLYVPKDAEPGIMYISARLRYETLDGGVADGNSNLPLEILPSHTPGLQDFEFFAKPTRANRGDAVTVSFHSRYPETEWITSCQAHFEGNQSENCDPVDDESDSVTLYVPKDARGGTMRIQASLRYETGDRVVGDANAALEVEVLVPLEPRPGTPRPANPGRTPPPTKGRPPTAATPSATILPQDVPAEATGSLPAILVIVAFLVILLAVIIAFLRSYRRRNSASHQEVQARARFVLGPTVRIVESSKRPPWAIRLDPSRGQAKEQIEEIRR